MIYQRLSYVLATKPGPLSQIWQRMLVSDDNNILLQLASKALEITHMWCISWYLIEAEVSVITSLTGIQFEGNIHALRVLQSLEYSG